MLRFLAIVLGLLVCAGCTRAVMTTERAPETVAVRKPAYARVLTCRDVDHHTVTLGRKRAEAAAAAGLGDEIGLTREHLIEAGYSRFRVVSRRVHCVAAPNAVASEHYCVATARLCANRIRR